MVKLKKIHSCKPTGSMFFEEELKFPRFYSIAIMILWSEFSNQMRCYHLQDIRKLKASSGFLYRIASFESLPAPSCDFLEIGSTLNCWFRIWHFYVKIPTGNKVLLLKQDSACVPYFGNCTLLSNKTLFPVGILS